MDKQRYIMHLGNFRQLVLALFGSKNSFAILTSSPTPSPLSSAAPSWLSTTRMVLALRTLAYRLRSSAEAASRIQGLWQNSCAFSINNDTLWEVFITALTISTRQRQPAPVQSTSQKREACQNLPRLSTEWPIPNLFVSMLKSRVAQFLFGNGGKPGVCDCRYG